MLGAGLLRLFSKERSERLWRALRWPASLRITTTKRQRAVAAELAATQQSLQSNAEFYAELSDALGIVLLSGNGQLIERARQLREDAENNARKFKELCDLLGAPAVRKDSTGAKERIARLLQAKDEAWAHAQEQIAATQALAEQQVAEAKRQGVELARAEREEGKAEGRAEVEAKVEAERAAPQLRPTWRIEEIADGHFDLRNSQNGISPKDVRDVSIEAPMLDFAFDGSNQWPGYFPGAVAFEGRRMRRLDVRFVVRWRDGVGDPHAGEAILEGKPRRAVVL